MTKVTTTLHVGTSPETPASRLDDNATESALLVTKGHKANCAYVEAVHRFGAPRLRDPDDNPINISHEEDIDPSLVRSDGNGHVVGSPLVWRKDCWGRPERFMRGHRMARPYLNKDGEQRLGVTPCDRCKEKSPGTYRACASIVDERIRSSTKVTAAVDTWLTACRSRSGLACFTSVRGRLWGLVLQEIIDHGGWTNVNDQQVAIEALRLDEENRKKRSTAARAHRKRQSHAARGKPMGITAAFLQAAGTERDRRAADLRGLRGLSGRRHQAMMWLKNLPDSSCDRIADVWWSREILLRRGEKVTGKAIAEHMIAHGRDYGRSCSSLTTRALDDLKRIEKFESSRAGAPIWAPWVY
jgi:hypothetical protein